MLKKYTSLDIWIVILRASLNQNSFPFSLKHKFFVWNWCSILKQVCDVIYQLWRHLKSCFGRKYCLTIFLPTINEHDTSHKWYMQHGILAGNHIPMSIILFCLVNNPVWELRLIIIGLNEFPIRHGGVIRAP